MVSSRCSHAKKMERRSTGVLSDLWKRVGAERRWDCRVGWVKRRWEAEEREMGVVEPGSGGFGVWERLGGEEVTIERRRRASGSVAEGSAIAGEGGGGGGGEEERSLAVKSRLSERRREGALFLAAFLAAWLTGNGSEGLCVMEGTLAVE